MKILVLDCVETPIGSIVSGQFPSHPAVVERGDI